MTEPTQEDAAGFNRNSPAGRLLVWIGLRRVQYVLDLVILATAFLMAYTLRFGGVPDGINFRKLVFQLPYVVLLQAILFHAFGIYSFVWRYISLREIRPFVHVIGSAGALMLLVRLVTPSPYQYARVPISVILIDGLLVLMGSLGIRILRRVGYERSERRLARSPAHKPVFLIGAGQAGVLVAKEIRARGGMEPVGFVDDDPEKQGTVIQGLRVLGSSKDLPALAREHQVKDAIITIANAPGPAIRKLVAICDRIPINVQIIPGLYQILDGTVSIAKVRDIQIEDLLGREPVHLLREPVEKLIHGRVVMVTGAGGSIGAGLARQVCRIGCGVLVLVERAETPLFDIHRELQARHSHVTLVPAVADICDTPRMTDLFAAHRPQVVIHAAAHKHVPMMEYNPGEAIKNNVVGTQVVADLAHRFGAGSFVLISTDKAVNPTSVMGSTKRLAEIYVQGLSERSKTRFLAVRFGNVLGSTGSVVPIFKGQIAAGGPVTVTHPDANRYFMTLEEATHLVLEAAALGEGGEIFVLDMGEPVSVLDLAKDMITLSGLRPFEDIDIVFTGLRPGEKMFEELSFSHELMERTRHPKIFIGRIRPEPSDRIKGIMAEAVTIRDGAPASDLRRFLRDAIPESHLEVEWSPNELPDGERKPG